MLRFILKGIRRYSRKRDEKIRAEKMAVVDENVQIREFDGRIFICYNDIPLVDEAMIEIPICNAVKICRKDVKKYYKLTDTEDKK